MTADSAYWNHRCCNTARAAGLQPGFRPKGNAILPRHISDAFDRMTYCSIKFVDGFRSRYHRRSMAETRYCMEKTMFGERLRCMKTVSGRNEVPLHGRCATMSGCWRRVPDHDFKCNAKSEAKCVHVRYFESLP